MITLTRSRLMMGHVPVNISIQTVQKEKQRAIDASEGAYELAAKLESQISEYQPTSEVSCLNQKAGKEFCAVSSTTLDLLQKSLKISEQTDHAFDIRFASKSIKGVRGNILLHAEPAEASLQNSDTKIGVGSIGKGFIVDKMIDYLKSQGFEKVLIDAGGDLRAVGGPWKVAIQIPSGQPGDISNVMEITDRAWGSSGLYEQGHHITDPRTLKRVEGTGSVTVEADNLTLAGSLGTAFFVMGEQESIHYLNKFSRIKIYWINPQGIIHVYP
jgi:thiamine biosynthesis lipoprotein